MIVRELSDILISLLYALRNLTLRGKKKYQNLEHHKVLVGDDFCM